MAIRRHMNKRDFEATIKRLEISERGVEMARRVLVGGERQSDIATEFGITNGAVSHQVNRVWRAYVDTLEIPPGYERVTVVLPADKAAIVKTWAREQDRRSRS